MNRQRYVLVVVLFCIVLATFDSSYGAAAPQRGARRGRQGRTREPRSRQGARGQQAQEAQGERRQEALDNATGAIDTGLVDMLNLVNQQRRPNKRKLASIQEAVQKSRKYIKQFQDNIVCQFLMLNAWTNYFDTGAENALSPATQAYRKDNSNNDARATQAAIAVRNVSSGNILNLDADSIKADWLGRKVGQFSLNCLNGTTFAYSPAEANLCVLFWKLAAADLADYASSADGEPNEPAEMQRTAPIRQRSSYPSRPGRMERMAPGDRFRGRMPPGRRPGFYGDEEAATSDPVSMQISALGNLFNSKFQDPEVKFVGINTNSPRAAPAVVAKMLQSPMPWAQAMLSAPAAVSAFSTLDLAQVTSDQPVLVIVDKTGTVRYAGPAEGFLAPMVVDDLLGRKTDSAAVDSSTLADEQIFEPVTAVPAEPSQETPDTAPPTTEYVPVQNQPTQDTEITPEDFQAQKLLAYAKGLFIPAGRKKFMTSKMGVDLCRQIIREYPNTTYADEARKLLRTVPPNEQKRYNITPEEMGL